MCLHHLLLPGSLARHIQFTPTREVLQECVFLSCSTHHFPTTTLAFTTLLSRFTMANFSDTPTIQSNASPHVSILDIFLPGSTRIITAIEKLVSGKLNDLVSIFCLLGILAYGAKHTADYLLAWGDDHLSM